MQFLMMINTYRAGADREGWIASSFGHKGLDFVPCVIACVVVRSDDGLDDLAIVVHFGQDFRFLSLHPRGLHGREDFGLFPLGHATESNRWN